MLDSPASPTVQLLDRLNLRLAPETFSAIDAARTLRPGSGALLIVSGYCREG